MKILPAVGVGLITMGLGMAVGCSKKERPPTRIETQVAQGRQVFDQKGCAHCHAVGKEPSHGSAPNLAVAVYALDSTSVDKHLRRLEQSKMPPVPLTSDEVRALVDYVTHAHAIIYQKFPDNETDAQCLVCGAGVKKQDSEKRGLVVIVEADSYYFDCADCQKKFLGEVKKYVKAPEGMSVKRAP